ncbi:MAG TPA: sensor histidine kinase [Candidatus Paenibacillus intestinavium]|nr:sensor histidine kinase [Candidatus Paenibacillus intestinavium]
MESLFNNSSEAMFLFDAQGIMIGMNPAAEYILDPNVLEKILTKEENKFCYACRGYTSEEELMTCMNCYLSDPTADRTSFQIYLETKSKETVPFSASFQMIDPDSGTHILMLRDLTNQLVTQESLYRNKMMKSIIKAQEDERKRISRELHDSVAQELLSSLVDLRLLKYLEIQDNVLQKICQTEASLARLLEQIRNLSVELRPASLDDLGLEAAFRSHFKWIKKNYGVLVHFVAELHGSRYNNEIETVVYRICQETILNALKYANVDEISVRLFESKHNLELIVADQGIGFNINMKDSRGTGLGFYGMRERAELVNGQLTIASELGAGTTVHLHIPLLQPHSDREC